VDAQFDTSLSLRKAQDCDKYSRGVLRLLLAQPKAPTEERLYSTLNWDSLENQEEAVYKKPSVASAVLLLAGCAVGAGVLALPAVTRPVGFVPSSVALCGTWAYLAFTGLLVAEVALATMASTGQRSTSMQSMAAATVGPAGANLTALVFVFFHYATMTAFIARGGEILGTLLPGLASMWINPCVAFALGLGGFMMLSKGTDLVEQANNLTTAVVIISFVGLFALTVPQADASQLFVTSDWHRSIDCIPTMLQGLSFQSVVPTICAQLEGDRRKITPTIIFGSAVPLIMFLIWNGVLLACTSNTPLLGNPDPLEVLRVNGGPVLSAGIVVFSMSAIITSFIGFVVTITDFIADAFKPQGAAMAPDTPVTRLRDYGLALLPPLAIACYDPTLFFQALDKAGAFGVSYLFGLLPAWMALKLRANEARVLGQAPGLMGGYKRKQMAPGGEVALVLAAAAALWVIVKNGLDLFAGG